MVPESWVDAQEPSNREINSDLKFQFWSSAVIHGDSITFGLCYYVVDETG